MDLFQPVRCASVSLLSRTTRSPLACAYPAIFPPVKPRFSGKASSFISGNCERTYSTEPSFEPLSTRIVSKSQNVWRLMAERQSSRKGFPFQLRMMTLISGVGITVLTTRGLSLLRVNGMQSVAERSPSPETIRHGHDHTRNRTEWARQSPVRRRRKSTAPLSQECQWPSLELERS